jgi:hypothetical protein
MLAQLIHVMLIWAANTFQLLLTTVILAYMLLAIAKQELLRHLFLVMITILAPQTVAIKPLDSVFSLLSTLTTTTLAQPTGVMLQLELFTMMLLFVTTRILALTNLAILKQDVSSHTMVERIVMITTFAPLTDALKI